MRSACPEMNRTFPTSRLDETLNIRNADFELQRRGNSVQRHETVGILTLSVMVQVDEARGNDQAPRIDYPRARQRFGGDSRDRLTANPYVADAVEVRLRINHTS